MTTLEDLKRAVERYVDEPIGNSTKQRFRADAWRTAYEWRDSRRIPMSHQDLADEREGYALIERLK